MDTQLSRPGDAGRYPSYSYANSMLTTYASYAATVWIGFAMIYVTRFLGGSNASSAAVAYMVVLPFVFISPSVEFLIHIDESERKAISNYENRRSFAILRQAAIGASTGMATLSLLYFAWETGWSYSQSSKMTTGLLLLTLALSIAGPAIGLSFMISRAKAFCDTKSMDVPADVDG